MAFLRRKEEYQWRSREEIEGEIKEETVEGLREVQGQERFVEVTI